MPDAATEGNLYRALLALEDTRTEVRVVIEDPRRPRMALGIQGTIEHVGARHVRVSGWDQPIYFGSIERVEIKGCMT